MDNFTNHINIPVELSGCIASQILQNATHGRIAAVFNSSFYIESDAGYICIGNDNFEPSALNLVTKAPADTNWSASGLRPNEVVIVRASTIAVANQFLFLMANASTWSPVPVSCWSIADLEFGINTVRCAAASHVGSDGLGRMLIPGFKPGDKHLVCTAAQKPIASLQNWLTTAIKTPKKMTRLDLKLVHQLIGLGPGLTPSGDDFVGGMMIALHATGETNICRHLWQQIQYNAEDATNPISYAHIKAASKGKGCQSIHRTLSAILTGCPSAIRNCLANVDRIGHTSGWDIVTGMIIALECWHKAQIPHVHSRDMDRN